VNTPLEFMLVCELGIGDRGVFLVEREIRAI
jgi:hypothetical protein